MGADQCGVSGCDWRFNANTYCHRQCYSYSYGYGHSDGDTDRHTEADAHTKIWPIAETSFHTGTSSQSVKGSRNVAARQL